MMKKKITTTIIVYANTDDGEVISAKQFEELVAEKTDEFMDESWRKNEWLERKNVNAADVLDMTPDERADLESEWETAVTDMAREELLEYDWTENEVEVEIEVEIQVEHTVSIQAV